MRSIAVITPSADRFREYALARGPVVQTTRDRATGDGWCAFRIERGEMPPAGVRFTEIVVLEGYGCSFDMLCAVVKDCLEQMDAHVLPVAA